MEKIITFVVMLMLLAVLALMSGVLILGVQHVWGLIL